LAYQFSVFATERQNTKHVLEIKSIG